MSLDGAADGLLDETTGVVARGSVGATAGGSVEGTAGAVVGGSVLQLIARGGGNTAAASLLDDGAHASTPAPPYKRSDSSRSVPMHRPRGAAPIPSGPELWFQCRSAVGSSLHAAKNLRTHKHVRACPHRHTHAYSSLNWRYKPAGKIRGL